MLCSAPQEFLLLLLIINIIAIQGQVTIGSGNEPDSDALLDLKEESNGSATKGLVLPRVLLQLTTLAAPLQNHMEGMFVYNTAKTGDEISRNNAY